MFDANESMENFQQPYLSYQLSIANEETIEEVKLTTKDLLT
jgi:hypothetical protein